MIVLLLYVLIVSTVTISFIPSTHIRQLSRFGLCSLGLGLILSCLVLLKFNSNEGLFQEVCVLKISNTMINTNFTFGFDGLSIFFFVLSNLLIFLCAMSCYGTKNIKESLLVLHFTGFLLLVIFSSLDLLVFYIAFESILIPMFLLIGFSGSRDRKVRAAYMFFFYALVGSLLMLSGLIYIYFTVGTFSLEYLLNIDFTLEEQCFLWLSFFLAFASKVPVFPFHVWLPEAHVEAPAAGSVLLAGIMLKLGVYGFIRFSLCLFPEACLYFSPIVYSLCTFGIIYTSLSATRQTDLKRIIAYSSISHMNLVILGVFSFSFVGLEGSILQSINHGFTSSALFFLVGVLYDRYHSRFLYYYGGLVQVMPLFSALFLIFTFANIAIPGTSSFVGEFLILIGIYKVNIFCAIVSCTGVILCGGYSLWLYNRIFFGNLKISHNHVFKDLSSKEFLILIPLLVPTLIIGILPTFVINILHLSTAIISILSLN